MILPTMCLGSRDARHPLVAEIQHWGQRNLAGRLQVIDLPRHADFKSLRLSPKQTRERWPRSAARTSSRFRREIRSIAHEELTRTAMETAERVAFASSGGRAYQTW